MTTRRKDKPRPLTIDDFEEMEPMNDDERKAYMARRLTLPPKGKAGK